MPLKQSQREKKTKQNKTKHFFHQGNLRRLPSEALMIGEVIRGTVNQIAPHLPKCSFTNHSQKVKVSGFGTEAHKTIHIMTIYNHHCTTITMNINPSCSFAHMKGLQDSSDK